MIRRSAVLIVGLAWALFVSLPAHEGLGVLAEAVAFTVAPFVALTLAASWLRSGALTAAAFAVLAINFAAWLAVRSSTSSTAPVALLFAPFFCTVVVVPAFVLVSRLNRRARSGQINP